MTDSPDNLLKDCEKILLSKAKDACREWMKGVKLSDRAATRQ
jgi:hypothetical protein